MKTTQTQSKLPFREGEAFIGTFFKTEKKARAFARKNNKNMILATKNNFIVI